MINKLKPKSEFSRNVLTLMTGTTIAQAIPIAISPILTRIYSPEDFGVFALFVAIASIFGSIVNGRYELAIMLPKKNENAINVVALGLVIAVFISFILLILVIFFKNYFIIILRNKEIGIWLYFIPVTVFFIGLFNILSYWNNRKKYYQDIANATIIKSIILSIIQLFIGILKPGVAGLISGQIISNMFANMKLIKNISKDKILLSKIDKTKMIALAKKYKDFPKFSMPAILANSLSQNLTNILISSFYNVTTLGFYSLVQRVLGVPSALVGSAIGQVFFQQATQEKQETGKAIKTFDSTLKKLTIIGLLLFGTLFFTVEYLFVFIFGEKWRIAGVYAHILLPLFFIRFLSSALSAILIVFEKQKNELLINMFLITTSIIMILVFNDFNQFLFFFTAFMSINYIIFLFYYYRVSKGIA